jgi:Trypsin Inhibitor like cysteine rich domain
MNLAIVLTVVLVATLQPILADPPPCTGPNEVFSDCGNLCEDSCANNCDVPAFRPFALFNATTNQECFPGCYCKENFIRNEQNQCVLNEPGVCSKLENLEF